MFAQVVSKAKKIQVWPMNYQTSSSLGYCLIDIKVTVYGNTTNTMYENIYVFFSENQNLTSSSISCYLPIDITL